MSRVALASIKSLTFYRDVLTQARRTDPIPQLNCLGKACTLFTPDVVRCINVGGEGTEVDWKCEADLPEALRFGRVEVSCEGWSAPGDPYIFKGSCALNYRLVQIPDALRQSGDQHGLPSRQWQWFQELDLGGIVFMVLWTSIILFVLYSFLKSCWRTPSHTARSSNRPNRPYPGSGWFPGTYRDNGHPSDPPPPYSKNSTSSAVPERNWSPGFWTGAALGGLGTYLFSNSRSQNAPPRQDAYDWERRQRYMQSSSLFSNPASQRRTYNFEDRGEGSSTSGLGSMRRSTGLGGSNVR